MAKRKPVRAGMTITELTVALAILAVVGIIVAQVTVWSLQERARLQAQQAAVELAANILEAARAQPWEQLDEKWTARQTVPSEMSALLPEGKVLVTVQAGPHPSTKRVSVEVRWQFEPHLPAKSTQLTTLLSPRSSKSTGGKS